MLQEFRVRTFQLDGWHFLPLPKLNRLQQRVLNVRIKLVNERLPRGEKITYQQVGYVRARQDPLDTFATLLPALLRIQREPVPMDELQAMYYSIDAVSGRVIVRFNTRLESGRRWDILRKSGESGLTPDEHRVVSSLLSASKGSCTLVTDYPSEDSKAFRVGQRQYYLTDVPAKVAGNEIRPMGARGPRNAYLPRSGIMELEGLRWSESQARETFSSLGDWSFLAPSPKKL